MPKPALPQRLAGLLYGAFAYLAFNAVVIYCVGFLGNFIVPWSIDAGRLTPGLGTAGAIAINVALLTLFAVHHSVTARPAFKSWLGRRLHPELERATYVIISGALLALVMWQWRPLPQTVWRIENEAAQALLWALFASGWLLALAATFFTDHFELLGMKQALAYFRGQPSRRSEFRENAVYKRVRHPIMLGQIVAFWATPEMSLGHLLFASLMLVYTLIGLYYEERDLVNAHGDSYRDYQRRTPKLIPRLRAAPPKKG